MCGGPAGPATISRPHVWPPADGIASVTYEPASLREGLSLVVVETHRVDALVRLDITAATAAVAEIVASRSFRARLQAVPGYHPA